MANRHLARSIVLQTLFEWDFAKKSDDEIEDILVRIAKEFAPGMGDFSFVRRLITSILERRSDIDTIIEKAAPEWPIDKISIVDRNILRIGLCELLFADRSEVPAKVALNEAIELAKTYGGESSGRFINGVLGAVYKEMGEPGRDDVSPKKKKKDIPYEEMLVQRLGGAVVFARDGEEVYLALVHDVFGHWTLSKGKLEDGESAEDGMVREIKEEIGLDVIIKQRLGENEYVASHPEKGKYRKHVTYFLAESLFVDITLEKKGGLDDAKWFKLVDILGLNIYNDILPIVTKAINILLKKDTTPK
ncbi:transcription antitermination factor NusB [Patescibacteria group bacterium]|nr:transcription antitermination factor NusB [Patescibacteria group bacterium]